MGDRPNYPADLERSLFLECGHRCAMCGDKPPLVIDHIEEWAKVKEHKFENMIVLCTVCHALKQDDSKPRHINRASLRLRKSQLLLLNARYSDLERRFLDVCKAPIKADPTVFVSIILHHTMFLQMHYLVKDEFVAMRHLDGGLSSSLGGVTITNDQIEYTLTPFGRSFVLDLIKADP